MVSSVPPAPLTAERVLQIVGSELSELTGEGEWVLQPGPLLKGPGTLGVRLGPADSDNFRHIDLEFLLNVDVAETSLMNCATGLSADPEEAVRQAVAGWAATTARAALEFAEGRGRFAEHFPPGVPGGFPGWHAIISSVSAWGWGPQRSAKMQWFLETSPWMALAPVISTGLDREFLNGVRLFVGQGGDFEGCEVKINGRLHEESTAALMALDWPRTEEPSGASTFVLLIRAPTRPQPSRVQAPRRQQDQPRCLPGGSIASEHD